MNQCCVCELGMEGEVLIHSGQYVWLWQRILKHESVFHRGFFTHRDQRYMIKPLKNTDQEEHAVLTYNQEKPDSANHTCGVKNVGRKHGRIRTSRSLNSVEVSVAFLCHHLFRLAQQWYVKDCCAQQWLIQGKPRIYLLIHQFTFPLKKK